MKPIRIRLRPWQWIVLAVVLVYVLFSAHSYWSRYSSWSNLTKAKLEASAKWYVANRAPGHQACLYAVKCSNGRARLEQIKNLEKFDLDAAKQLAWDRRFHDACPGWTANFALELAPGGPEVHDSRRRAVWSFYNDRFVPSWGRLQDWHAFSEREAEPCAGENAVTVERGPTAAP